MLRSGCRAQRRARRHVGSLLRQRRQAARLLHLRRTDSRRDPRHRAANDLPVDRITEVSVLDPYFYSSTPFGREIEMGTPMTSVGRFRRRCGGALVVAVLSLVAPGSRWRPQHHRGRAILGRRRDVHRGVPKGPGHQRLRLRPAEADRDDHVWQPHSSTGSVKQDPVTGRSAWTHLPLRRLRDLHVPTGIVRRQPVRGRSAGPTPASTRTPVRRRSRRPSTISRSRSRTPRSLARATRRR